MLELKDQLRIIREKRGLSQSDLARRAGVKPQTIQSIESGKTRKPTNIVAIAAALSVTAEDLMSGKAQDGARNGHPRLTPIIGVVRAGAQSIDYSQGQGNLGEVEPPAMATQSTVALEVRGESMGGRVEEGDIVFYDERREPVTPDLYGRLCIVGASDGRVMLKKIKPGSRPGRFHLISYADEPEFDVPVDWAARVTNIRPRQ
jgi:transcriptional regulator with XRE-family HTH domain